MTKIIIIGGGISGLCSAYYLVKEGYEVTVIDKSDITNGTSFINAGFIVPSHFISMAAPGVITKGIKWMFDNTSPFYVKPRFDLEFFKWVLQFNKSATQAKVEKSIPILKEINLKSRELYEEIYSSLDFNFHYENKGLIMAYISAKGEKEELEIAERAVKEGLEATQLSKEGLQKLEPVFSDEVIGAVHYKCDSHTTPGQFMVNLKSWLKEKGVVFEMHQEVEEFIIDPGKIAGVKTNKATYLADEFVLTTGTWTPILAKSLGLKIPIQGGKGYSMDVYRPYGISIPAILVEAKIAVTPMAGFTRFAGTMEFSGNNDIISKNRIEAIASSVSKYYSNIELKEEEKKGAVSGLRPVSPDGLPFIGRAPGYENLTVASGHSMMGWSLGPLTGTLVTEIISERPSKVSLDPFRVDRFA